MQQSNRDVSSYSSIGIALVRSGRYLREMKLGTRTTPLFPLSIIKRRCISCKRIMIQIKHKTIIIKIIIIVIMIIVMIIIIIIIFMVIQRTYSAIKLHNISMTPEYCKFECDFLISRWLVNIYHSTINIAYSRGVPSITVQTFLTHTPSPRTSWRQYGIISTMRLSNFFTQKQKETDVFLAKWPPVTNDIWQFCLRCPSKFHRPRFMAVGTNCDLGLSCYIEINCRHRRRQEPGEQRLAPLQSLQDSVFCIGSHCRGYDHENSCQLNVLQILRIWTSSK